MYNWIVSRHNYAVLILTKLDKLKKSEIEKNTELIKSTLGTSENDVIIHFSSVSGTGKDEALELIEKLLRQ